MIRGNIVKYDSGAYAVFTVQGSSAPHMTPAKVIDVIVRLPGCAGQAADAVSAYTQAKMVDAPGLFKIPKSECPDMWIRLLTLAGLLWERQFEEVPLALGWEKVPNW